MFEKLFILIFLVFTCFSCTSSKVSQSSSQENHFNFIIKENILVGKIPITYLLESDSSFIWFKENINKYKVKDSLALKIKPIISDIKMEVYLGTWCGDTKRMLPKFIKILDYVNYDLATVNFYALDHQKKGLNGIERKNNILYVPTIIFYRNGKEINRIVENHVKSVEADMLNILTNNNYRHSLLK